MSLSGFVDFSNPASDNNATAIYQNPLAVEALFSSLMFVICLSPFARSANPVALLMFTSYII
jgi:hypothetical protein